MTAPNADSVALELALEAVLIRYGIPAQLGIADRGDLASDLADAARRAQIDGSVCSVCGTPLITYCPEGHDQAAQIGSGAGTRQVAATRQVGRDR